ncbi:5'-3' exonuclease [Ilumatobacter sp.]|uniref:5'-3' exonuclease n=1 Tax=Ilumatobacter sp. TaxID=1967498 RepID=UPI003AF5B57D
MTRVHLVDGTFELFRCFHGAPRATGPAGDEVGAARALFATLVALLDHQRVTHAAVAFDSVIAPATTKAPASPDDLIGAQQPLAADVVRALGLPVWPAGRFQADDLLASGAVAFAELDDVGQVVVCTTDNDLAQCVRSTRVVLLDRIRGVVTDELAVREKFGVDPEQIPDLFGLVGDRSDGIAGVPGWGQVSAAKALDRYRSIEAIPRIAAEWDVEVRGRERLATALAQRRDEALLARDLSVRRGDLPVPAELAAIEWRGASRPLVERLVERLDDDSTVVRIPRWSD